MAAAITCGSSIPSDAHPQSEPASVIMSGQSCAGVHVPSGRADITSCVSKYPDQREYQLSNGRIYYLRLFLLISIDQPLVSAITILVVMKELDEEVESNEEVICPSTEEFCDGVSPLLQHLILLQ